MSLQLMRSVIVIIVHGHAILLHGAAHACQLPAEMGAVIDPAAEAITHFRHCAMPRKANYMVHAMQVIRLAVVMLRGSL